MSPDQIMWALDQRAVHVRQYLGRGIFEVWADGRFYAWASTAEEAEAFVRKLLGISNEDGVAFEAWARERLPS